MKVAIIFACLLAIAFACEDKWKNCNQLKRLKVQCKRVTSRVAQHCQKTCGYCGSPVTPAPPPTPIPGTVTQAPGSCGKRQVSISRVIGGVDAKPGQWPWQILLQGGGRPMCGGSIINKRYVITAAHCVARVSSASYYSVKVGETDRTKPEGSEAVYQAEKVIAHPSYNRPGRLMNDFAIIKLNKDIQFNKYVQPVCLPSGDIPPGSKNCYITGFGKIKHPGFMHTKLQQAIMPPVDSKVCYAKNKNIIPIQISPDMICAGEGGVNDISGCHGDSGGPYVCEVNGQWEVHGAVSHGSPRCSSKETYTVFARVNYFKSWIQAQMAQHGN